jgi:quaternary ammonium compound-resistance protein SugE
MNWLILIIAGIFEVGFATCIGKVRETTGTTATWWFAGFIVCLVTSIYLLYRVTQHLPVGTSYAVWTGIGAGGIVLVGIFLFKEPATFWRLFFLVTLIGSIIGLKVVS